MGGQARPWPPRQAFFPNRQTCECPMTSDAATANAETPRLQMLGISKSFGGVAALRDVDFVLHAGEIHGLVGENGAGKSTMMKIIAGVHADYDGRMLLDGGEVHFR